MSQPLRIENSEDVLLITTRTIGSRLWFVNNPALERKVLAFLARYQRLYGAVIYAFCLMGNHYHLIARFPRCNKAAFMRSFNAMFAKLVQSEVEEFDGGPLWSRRYAEQVLPRNEDIEHWYYYCALNAVLAGLVKDPREYSGYNSFQDSVRGRKLKFKLFRRWEYNEAKRKGCRVKPQDYLEDEELTFTRLPGYEDKTQSEYAALLTSSMKHRCATAVAEKIAKGEAFPPKLEIRKTGVGQKPLRTKKSSLYSYRPLVLSLCRKTRNAVLRGYFAVVDAFREASERYRRGDDSVVFPPGTYRPLRLNLVPS
ncbi:MAG: transposase [Oligoflexia bacterium]|nr:transposase [Oligoflexia bacterium]